MTKLITGFIAILMFVGQNSFAQCPSGNLTFTTQSEIDNFESSHPSCADFSGNITVHGDAIIDVDGLTSLQKIQGNLVIKNSKNLTNLDGLINLTEIGGKLELKGCNKLNNLEGLSSLISIGGTLTIMQNDILSDCTGLCDLLAKVGVAGTIKIQHNATGCNSEAEVNTVCALILPVELISFKGYPMDRTNVLKWQTATEENTMVFIVERSLNGTDHFKEVDRINAVGNSDVIQSYEIEDNDPVNIAYYRLRIVDFDGYFEYSDLVVIKRSENDNLEVEAFPVPTENEVTILIPTKSVGSAILTLSDFTGRVLKQEKIELNNGLNRFSINLNDYNTNLYFLSIDNGKEKIVKKLLKVNMQ